VATQSITYEFLSRGAASLARDFRSTGDSASAAARGAAVLQKVIADLGQKENRTAAESVALAKALRLTGDAEDRAAAKALAADIAIRRLDDALKDSSKSTGGARAGFASLAGEVTGFGAASDAATSGGNKFKLALAGLNLASGVLEPALAGVVVAAGGLAAAFSAAGAGVIAYQVALKPLLSQTTDVMKAQAALDKAQATAQANYAAAIKSGVSAKTADAARTKAMTAAQQQYNLAVAAAPAPVREFARAVEDTKSGYTAWADSLARPVLSPLSTALKIVEPALKAITPLVRVTAGAFGMLVTEISRKVDAGGLTSVVTTVLPHVRDTILDLGHAAGNVAAGIWGILKAFMPVSGQITAGVVKLTAKFKEWGQSLSGGTGFQSLMTTFRTETPQAMAILTNLGTVITNVGKAMFGLSSFSNSRLLLSALLPLSGVMASLSKNTDLVRIAMYALLAVKIGQQFSWVTDAWKGIVKFAAAAEGATVAETIAAAATRAWGLAMTALPWVALATAVVAVALLIIKYHQQIWTFIQKVWHDILAVIMGVWNWVRTNWPLLLGIITGPIGLAILWVVQHFGEITTAVKAVLNAVQTAWNAVWGAIRAAFAVFISAGIIAPFNTITGAIRTVLSAVSSAWNNTWNTLKAAFRIFVVDGVLGPLGLIINGAAKAFSWVPLVGDKLKGAAAAFNTFRANVNSSLGGINGRTVNVSVAMTSATNPYGGITPKTARGWLVSGGTPGRDSVPILAMPGELVVPTHIVRAGAVDHLRGRIPGFAAGGVVGAPGTGVVVAPHTPTVAQVQSTLMASVMKLAVVFAKAAQAAAKAAAGGAGTPGPGGGAPGANAALARRLMPSWGSGAEWNAWNYLEMREAGWNQFARNPSSGAYGIPQALPPGKMGAAANPPQSNPTAQIRWMIGYIQSRYGDPIAAAAHERAFNWYGGGLDAMFTRPTLIGVGERGPEHVQVTPGGGGGGDLGAKLDRLIAEVRQLTGVAAGIPAATGRHVGGAINSSAGAASFRNRYPQGGA
jgi:hypothetical protein